MKSSVTQYRHIIWDWNGTLFDDVRACVDSMNTLLHRRKKHLLSLRRYLDIFDFPVKVYYQRVGFDFDEESFEALAREYIEEYDRQQWECTLHPQAPEVLQYIREHEITQSILSACHQDRLEQIINHFGIAAYFHDIVGLSDYYAACKVNNGQRYVEKLGLSASKILLIGDTTHDAEVAQTLGVDCVLIEGGHHPREKLETTGLAVKASLQDLFH